MTVASCRVSTAGLPRLARPSRRADVRVAAAIAAAAIDPDRPLIANLIVTRRCNLSCGYCLEYDHVSAPVPLAVLRDRLDHLARLRSVFVTLTGGETLLHPDAATLVADVRARGMIPFVNTNGFLLTREWIEKLNDAGLYGMQLSIDGMVSNDVSKKSLKPLMPKLRLLAQYAKFRVRINTVLGSGPPPDAVEVTRVVRAFGFDASCSLMRHGDGSLVALDAEARAAYETIRDMGQRASAFVGDDFQLALADGEQAGWKCRAGARTFHVCENGLVHLCAPRVGNPGVPIESYDVAAIRRAFNAPKACASRCPIAYAHHASRLDGFRSQRGVPDAGCLTSVAASTANAEAANADTAPQFAPFVPVAALTRYAVGIRIDDLGATASPPTTVANPRAGLANK
jgi:MoaA/NifB/PqqE/SkfB family radical SAM enzyme